MRKTTPRAGPSAGRVSTCSEIVPGTTPVLSSGTSTCEHRSPGVSPQGVPASARSPCKPTGVQGAWARPKPAGLGAKRSASCPNDDEVTDARVRDAECVLCPGDANVVTAIAARSRSTRASAATRLSVRVTLTWLMRSSSASLQFVLGPMRAYPQRSTTPADQPVEPSIDSALRRVGRPSDLETDCRMKRRAEKVTPKWLSATATQGGDPMSRRIKACAARPSARDLVRRADRRAVRNRGCGGIVANARHAGKADLATRALNADKLQGRTAVQIAAGGGAGRRAAARTGQHGPGLVAVRASTWSFAPGGGGRHSRRATRARRPSRAAGTTRAAGVRRASRPTSDGAGWRIHVTIGPAAPSEQSGTAYAVCLEYASGLEPAKNDASLSGRWATASAHHGDTRLHFETSLRSTEQANAASVCRSARQPTSRLWAWRRA